MVLQAEKSKTEEKKIDSEDIIRIIKDKGKRDKVVLELKQTLETMKRSYKEQLQQLEINANDSELELKQRLKEAECLLSESRERREQIEAELSSKYQNWSKKEDIFQSFIALLLRSVQVFLLILNCFFVLMWHKEMSIRVLRQGLRESYNSTKHEIVDTEKRWSEEFTNLGKNLLLMNTFNFHILTFFSYFSGSYRGEDESGNRCSRLLSWSSCRKSEVI